MKKKQNIFLILFLLLTLILSFVLLYITGAHEIELPAAPHAESMTKALNSLYSCTDGNGEPDFSNHLPELYKIPEAIALSIYLNGKKLYFHHSSMEKSEKMLQNICNNVASDEILGRLSKTDKLLLNFRLDLIMEKRRVFRLPEIWFGHSFVPLIDGVAAKIKDKEVYLTANILEDKKAYKGSKSLGEIGWPMPISPKKIDDMLARQMGLAPSAIYSDAVYSRFRGFSYLRWKNGDISALNAGRVKKPPISIPRIKNAAVAGGVWLANHTRKNGKFVYEYYPKSNRKGNARLYNLPRHGGTTYSLFLLYLLTGKDEFKAAGLRALDWTYKRLKQVKDDNGLAFTKKRQVKLGSQALGLLGMVFARRAGIDDERLNENIDEMAKFIGFLQMEKGDFIHYWNVKKHEPLEKRVIYYSGEAAYAMAALARDTKNPAYIKIAEKALDFYVKENMYFLREFFGITDSWICMAIEEFSYINPKPEYAEYARVVANAYIDNQLKETDPALAHYTGGFSPSVVMPPSNTPAASNIEGMVGSLIALKNSGLKDERIEEGMMKTIKFLVDAQYQLHDGYRFKNPDEAKGAWPGAYGNDYVRVDYVQHASSALIRGAKYLEETAK